jgi:hypothetical protein
MKNLDSLTNIFDELELKAKISILGGNAPPNDPDDPGDGTWADPGAIVTAPYPSTLPSNSSDPFNSANPAGGTGTGGSSPTTLSGVTGLSAAVVTHLLTQVFQYDVNISAKI